MLLKDKVVVITGSTRGIGKGIALKVAEEGGIPVISGFEKDLLEDKLPKEFEALGYKDLLYVELDVTSVESIQNLMKVTYEKYGRIDAVCANAGITDMCKFVDMTPERFDHMISINLRGVYATDWAAIPYFLKQGYGKIVNTASDCALEGWEYLSSYSAAKFGVRGLTQSLAKEFGRNNINVNCVCPGIIDTDIWVTTDRLLGELNNKEVGQSWKDTVATIPLGRGGTPEDIGNGVVMLLSKYADYITGCSLPVGGGSSIH